jgi:hypothetical protein
VAVVAAVATVGSQTSKLASKVINVDCIVIVVGIKVDLENVRGLF